MQLKAVDLRLINGKDSVLTALDDADWRIAPITEDLRAELKKLHPPRSTEFIGDALGYLLFAQYNQRRRRDQKKITTWKGWPAHWSHAQSSHHQQETPQDLDGGSVQS